MRTIPWQDKALDERFDELKANISRLTVERDRMCTVLEGLLFDIRNNNLESYFGDALDHAIDLVEKQP